MAQDDETLLSKRGLLGLGVSRAGEAGAAALEFALENVADRFTPRVQRPPGALSEFEFLFACTRCGECITACPPGALLKLGERAGAAAGTPFLEVNELRPCVACEDVPCIHACDEGALRLIDIADAVMGMADIDRETCRPWIGNACDRCYNACPFPGDAIICDEEGRPYIDPRHCIGCGMCRAACPTPKRSIRIQPPARF